ncbi:MAG TPA: ABC transporter substrate-binding protein [Frankiaceae bacterium]|jgi:ABC-type branched-subunit amino acid transport system substrate-binding protein|nr:ABC transporter substrate-binding protein [Frankiaceae bacterium]
MKRVSLFAVLAVGVLVGGACSSSSKGSSTAPSSGPSSSTASTATTKASGPGIVDGQVVIGSTAGPEAPGFEDGIKARIDSFNKAGGAGGVKVKYVGNRNNNDDPNQDLTLMKQLALQDHAYSVLTYPTLTQPAAAQFLQKQNVPLIGDGFNPVMCNNNNSFGYAGCVVAGIAKQPAGTLPVDAYFKVLVPKILKTLKGAKIALVGQAVGGGQQFTDLYTSTAKALGVDVVYSRAVIPLTASQDFQPFASAVIATHPDAVITIVGSVPAIAFKAKMIQDGYKGPIFDNTYSPALLQDPTTAAALEGTYETAQTPTLQDTGEYVTQMKADFAADGITDSKVAVGTLIGYNSADFFVAALKKVAPNFSKFDDTINAGFTYAPAGGNSSTWPQDHAGFTSSCIAVTKVTNAKFDLVSPFTCYDKAS